MLRAYHKDDGDIDRTSANVVLGMLCDAALHSLKPVNSASGFQTYDAVDKSHNYG